MGPVSISVRKIVEHVLRCGDIDSRYAESSAMLEGAKAHRKIQAAMGEDYQKEVTLRLKMEVEGVQVVLTGRADGVIALEDGGFVIDEIKSTTLSLERFYSQRELHLGQAKCYAWMLLQTLPDPLATAGVQLTYYQLETKELERFRFEYTYAELEAFFHGLMARYGVWLRFERDWKKLRDTSIKAVDFPYPAYRRGQRELAVAAYRTIERKKKLYAQAPTGIGKTLSTLFPTVKAMGEGLVEKAFYLTAKTVTREVAEDAVRLMAGKGLRFKSVTLRAKDKICPQEETICNPEYCSRAKGHYDRINEALLDLLQNNDLITPAQTGEYAGRHNVCPHEMALDAALWTDLVVGDYNHVFDPAVYLRRFFGEGEQRDYVFLIDEAHNLGDRVREMYTASLYKSKFLHVKRELKDKNKPANALRKALGSVNSYLLDARKECGDQRNRVTYGVEVESGEDQGEEPQVAAGGDRVLPALVQLFTMAAEEWMSAEKNNAHPLQDEVLALYFESLAFLGICERYDSHYATITEVFGSEVVYTLFCLDPSQIIKELLGRARASVLFSATLTPLPYYRELLGGGEEDRMASLPSPFDMDRLLLVAHSGISTKYIHREDSVQPLADAVYWAVSQKRGNYLVYFPSYQYLRQVYEVFCAQHPRVRTLLQEESMGEEARGAFLREFSADNAETLVGFCVMGGIFSEGIDLKGERLIGSIIVGVGLPGISLRQDLIRDYFNRKNGRGYDYAYVFPGMNKVLQAAGRVIRSETDYGIAMLIDSRFRTAQYRELYPPHWAGLRYVHNLRELQELARDFSFFARNDPQKE